MDQFPRDRERRAGKASRNEAHASEVGGAFWLFLGLAFLTIALVMNRISQGIEKNGEVLKAFGAAVGDGRIPSASSGWQSVTHWLTVAIAIGGVGCLIFGLSELKG